MSEPRRRPLALLATVLVLLLVAGGAAFHVRGTWEVGHTKLVETVHVTPELTDEFRVLQVSDFHSLPRPEQVDQVVEIAVAARADLIALTGDLINTHNEDLSSVERLIAGLREAGAPVVAVDGNHEHWSAQQTDLHALYEQYGVTLMVDEHFAYLGPWGRAIVAATDDHFSGHGDLAAALDGAPEDAFRLLLTHSPDVVGKLEANGIDYAMCGHTHGGQIRLPFVGAIYAPGRNFFPEYSKGPYEMGEATLFIDSGVGVTGPKYRFLNQSQVVLHRFTSA
ncbi:MAG TPA: hypothetical protein GX013_05950 [Propionibacterium sp.]|nr:hypothetical protein [Propionibacterium sp.]